MQPGQSTFAVLKATHIITVRSKISRENDVSTFRIFVKDDKAIASTMKQAVEQVDEELRHEFVFVSAPLKKPSSHEIIALRKACLCNGQKLPDRVDYCTSIAKHEWSSKDIAKALKKILWGEFYEEGDENSTN
jgi:hypothetical protein